MHQSVLKGYLLALLGVVILSPDALLIRLAGNDPWAISLWRGLIGGGMVLVYNQWLDRRPLREQIRPAGHWFYTSTLIYAAAQFSFIYAITHANVTDVLVIVAFTPLLSALLSAVFLHERVLPRTWIATVICGVGLAVLFSQAGSQSEPQGLAAAVVCAVLMAAQFVVIRSCPDANLTATIGFGSILSGLVVMSMTGLVWMGQAQFMAVLAMALIVGPIPFVLFTLSLRSITAAETSLIMLLESVLGSWLVWLFLAEQPSLQTMAAGILILSTLSVYGLLALRDGRNAPAGQSS